MLTPLGAMAHMRVNSAAFDLCTEWHLLNAGRGALDRTDAMEWFDEEELAAAPVEIFVELLASSGWMTEFIQVLARSVVARDHILGLGRLMVQAAQDELELLEQCADIARHLRLRAAAQSAAVEAGT